MPKKKTSTKKKKPVKKGLKSSYKVGDANFKKDSCSAKKANATKKAESLRSKGYRATVKKNPTGGYCTYKGPKRKK